jgi:hypothetical protein
MADSTFDRAALAELGVIDVHVHVGPELVRRKYDVLTLAAELRAANLGAVLKNHFIPTTAWTSLARARGAVDLYGSVVLNHSVGGLNPAAIRAAISANKADPASVAPDRQRIMVWMPSIHAAAHLAYVGRDLLPEWGCAEQYSLPADQIDGIRVLERGELTEATVAILEAVRDEDLALATCHVSRDEVFALVERASAMGIQRIVVTHPFYQVSDLSVDEQCQLARYPGVYLEHSYAVHVMDHIVLDRYLQAIEAVGPEHTILSTDLGQVANPSIADGWCIFINLLIQAGLPLEDIRTMAATNPRRVLGDR